MPRLSRAQEDGRRRVSDLVASTLTPEALGERLLPAIFAAVPADGARLFGVDPATLLINRTIAATAGDDWARQEWLRGSYLSGTRPSYIEFPNLMRAGLMAVALNEEQESSWGYPPPFLASRSPQQHRTMFHETGVPRGGTLLVSIPADDTWVGALQLYRRDPSRPFGRGDVAFLRLIAPTLGRGLRAALARERALAAPPTVAPNSSGIIVVGADYRVQFSTPAGEAWSDLLRGSERGGHGPLPTALWSALAGERSGGAGGLVVPTPVGPVRIEASTGTGDGAVALVISQERPPTLPSAPERWALTPAERQVFAEVLSGEPNATIATNLHISENTVQTHLRHVYEKVGVGNRSQLLAEFFRETYSAAVR